MLDRKMFDRRGCLSRGVDGMDEDGTLTVRDRDTAKQERISAAPEVCLRYLRDQLGAV